MLSKATGNIYMSIILKIIILNNSLLYGMVNVQSSDKIL